MQSPLQILFTRIMQMRKKTKGSQSLLQILSLFKKKQRFLMDTISTSNIFTRVMHTRIKNKRLPIDVPSTSTTFYTRNTYVHKNLRGFGSTQSPLQICFTRVTQMRNKKKGLIHILAR
jgi:hypothetical protein